MTLVAAFAFLCIGCGGAVPPTHYYVLQAPDVPRVEAFGSATAKGLAIGVETFRVDPPYDQDRIVYRVGGETAEVGFYAYHRWAAPLERMLPGLVASVYDGVLGVKSIEPAGNGRSYDAYLRGRVLALEEIDTAGGTRVRIRLGLRLDGADGTELWSETVSREADASSREVAGIVERMRATLTEAIRQSRPSLRSALERDVR